MSNDITVLICGIGPGSLGLELQKSLSAAGGYQLLGADISPQAVASARGFAQTWHIDANTDEAYISAIADLCAAENVAAIAPGAAAVHQLLHQHRAPFAAQNVLLMLNSSAVIDCCSDKILSLNQLATHGIATPAQQAITRPADVHAFSQFPCIVKPVRDSGGSNMVFLAENPQEAEFFCHYLNNRGYAAMLQAYIDAPDEFTVGVLSTPTGEVVGSIALRRELSQKLSCMLKYADRVISSGWSQGEINVFSEVCNQAETMAKALDSRWALNVQGRLAADGVFYPFEINPRHSGTTYLRTMAGVNEPDLLLQHCLRGTPIPRLSPQPGYYTRVFTEQFAPLDVGYD